MTRYRTLTGAAVGLLLGLLTAGAAHAQTDSLGTMTRRFSRYQQQALPEKLFLHLDRPLYLSGETMWLKAYAVDGTSGQPLPLSTVAYVEVLNQKRQPVLQGKIALKNAVGQGSFVLPSALASGTYTVRAYTSWMQNFGPEYFFQRTVTVLNTFTASGAAPAKDSAAYDAQFFPEGGHLVQGLSSRVGFKVTDAAGRGLAATGRLLDQQGRAVATFKTLRFGMGSFRFTPLAGGTYTAVVTPAGRPASRRALPAAVAQGYVLRLDNSAPESLTLTVSATTSQPETVYLLGHSRQQVAVAAQATLTGGQAVFTIPKSQLLDGISHFTVFGANQQPLAERLYFQPPRQRLTITAQPNKAQYTTRDKVTLQLTATTGAPPAAASLSMAVYRLDSLTTAAPADIAGYLWLAADLKGTVEHPEYYCSATDPDAAQAADNLMLTQGWSRFRWTEALAAAPPALPYLPELHGPLARARLTQAGTNRPAPGILTYLSAPGRIIRLSNTVSNAEGLVQFELNDFYGPRDVVMQTDPQQDSTSRIELLSPFSGQYAVGPPALAVRPGFRPDYARRHFQAQVQKVYAGRYKNRYALAPADSTPFYGRADEIYLLDQYTRFKVLEEVMREYVPGVLVRARKDGNHLIVNDRVNHQPLTAEPMILLDGVPVFSSRRILAVDPLKIRKLEVVDSRYLHGSAVYQGLVSYSTYKGDLEGFRLDPGVLVQQYEGMQYQREFYAPRYDTPEQQQSRLPDLRNLLYWNPEVAPTSTQEFYTGDQAGRYLVVIQGLAGNGAAGSTSFSLEVKPAL